MNDIQTAALAKMKKYCKITSSDMAFSGLTTLGCGGKIKLTVFPQTRVELVRCLCVARQYGVKYVILGNGSNVLAGDGDFDGVVFVTKGLRAMVVNGCCVRVDCGALTTSVARLLAQNGLSGGEFLACLPGTIGGAVVTNAGCYGQTMSQVVEGVEVLVNDRKRHLTAERCAFEHRKSAFCDNSAVIISVKLRLKRGNPKQIWQLQREMLLRKKQTQPLDMQSAGSVFFHDRVPVSKYIDRLGLKGYCVGGAAVSAKHAGFIVNLGGAKAADVLAVAEHVEARLLAAYGIVPQRELRLVNFLEGGDVEK